MSITVAMPPLFQVPSTIMAKVKANADAHDGLISLQNSAQ